MSSTNDQQTNNSNHQCCVAVHVGAGYHSQQKASSYKATMKQACIAAMDKLRQGGHANDAVECAVRVLEDDSVTNAGIGSNLNRVGLVECDAAIMSSEPDAFGAVGAVSGICNPIQAANAILKCYSGGPDCHLGLVPPMLLVSEGADAWARARGIETNNNTRHKITEAALGKYEEYMNRITNVSKAAETGADLFNNGGGSQDLLMDTVGAVCVDSRGNVAAGVSSGGIALKYPGRVGEAAMFGCGCWAETQLDDDDCPLAVGCSVTGTGEQIMREMLAKSCAQRPGDLFTVLSDSFEEFNKAKSLSKYRYRSAGVVLLRHDVESNISELGIAHTTHSMGYGYMTQDMSSPKAKISRKPDSAPTTVTAIRL